MGIGAGAQGRLITAFYSDKVARPGSNPGIPKKSFERSGRIMALPTLIVHGKDLVADSIEFIRGMFGPRAAMYVGTTDIEVVISVFLNEMRHLSTILNGIEPTELMLNKGYGAQGVRSLRYRQVGHTQEEVCPKLYKQRVLKFFEDYLEWVEYKIILWNKQTDEFEIDASDPTRSQIVLNPEFKKQVDKALQERNAGWSHVIYTGPYTLKNSSTKYVRVLVLNKPYDDTLVHGWKRYKKINSAGKTDEG